MSTFSRLRVIAARPSMSSSSDNSPTSTSESAVSQPDSTSNYSSNTSSGAHCLSITPLPRGAEPPQVNLPISEYDFSINPTAKRKTRVLRKPHPPPSIGNPSTRNGILCVMADRGPPSIYGQVSVNLNHTASFPSPSHRQSLVDNSAILPTSSYEVSRHSHSLGDSYESQAIDRRIPPAEHAAHTFGTATRPTDALEPPHMSVVPVEENQGSHAITQNISHSRTSSMMNPPLVHRDKPLPSLPGLSPSFNGSAGSKPIDPPPSHGLLPYIRSSYPLSSDDGHAVPLFDPSVTRPTLNSSQFTRYAHTDVGHTQTWSGSGHSAPVTRYSRSESHGHVSKPQYRHDPDLPFRNYTRHFSTTSRPASCFPEFTAPSVPPPHPTHVPAFYTSEPPLSHTHSWTHGPSWGKRIMRALSIILFRKDTVTDNPIEDLSYLASDSGHGSTCHQPAGVAHALAPATQHKPQGSHPYHGSRKLRKRAPSLSHSRSSTPAPTLTSTSSALYPQIHTSREPVFRRSDAPSQIAHSEFNTTPKPRRSENRSTSNSRGYTTVGASMTRYTGLGTSTSTLPAQWIRSQHTIPTSSSARKLVKRHTRRKGSANAMVEHPSSALPPLRTQSPFNLNFNSPEFSNASRCRSPPILGPADSASGHFVSSRYGTFPTDSPSESLHASETLTAGEPSWSEHHHSLSRSQDLPSLLHCGSSRRWTLAVFDAPEEQMLEELDRLRNVGWGPGFHGELVRVKSRSVNNTDANDKEQSPRASLEKAELEGWLVARKALMVCREIMRTEKSYREGLIKLQRGETLKPPPRLMLQYLPALISASLTFSARLDDDPSTYGVSAAFLGAEDTIEGALVAWSGIVGEFFGAATGRQRRTLEKERRGTDKNKKDKNKLTGTPVLPPVIYTDLGHDESTHPKTKNVPNNRRKSMPSLSQLLTSSTETSPPQPRSWYFSASTVPISGKLPTVQDLAIQPTQRVMRYVLLYKDLCNSTPALSPARGLVERALEDANRIAQRCNRAQDNAAFLK